MTVLKNPFANPRSEGVPMNNNNNTGGSPSGGNNQQQQQQQNKNNKNATDADFLPGNNSNVNTNDNQGNDTTSGGGSDDPMADIDSLWHDDTQDANKQQNNNEPQTFLPKMDPAKLNEILGKMDFTRSIKPETFAKIKAGGDDAVAGLGEILNTSLRQALGVAFQASTRLVENGLTTAQGRFTDIIPNHVKDIIVENSLTDSNPFMSYPAFSPVVASVRSRIQSKFPKATPAQIEKATNNYFDKMYERGANIRNKNSSVNSQDNSSKLRTGASDADWETWLTDAGNEATQTQ